MLNVKDVRGVILLFGLSLTACGASTQSAGMAGMAGAGDPWPEPMAATAHEPVLVELQPPPSSLLASHAPLDRTALYNGEFVSHLQLSSQSGCSQSWSSTSYVGSVSLTVNEGIATIKVDLDEKFSAGSRVTPTATVENSRTHKFSWAGKVIPGERPSVFSASISLSGCDGGCPLPPIELRCERKQLSLQPLQEQKDPAREPEALDGIVCAGLEGIVGRGVELPKALPMADGAGVDVSASGFHNSFDSLRVTRHRERT